MFQVAERTRLELAASGVTGRRYNQLNYRSSGETLVRQLRFRRKHKATNFYMRMLFFRRALFLAVALKNHGVKEALHFLPKTRAIQDLHAMAES